MLLNKKKKMRKNFLKIIYFYFFSKIEYINKEKNLINIYV
jgi:hypothetical protein